MNIAEGTLGCIWIFGHQGPGLFSKRNPEMAVLRVIRGQNGMKLGRVGLWP